MWFKSIAVRHFRQFRDAVEVGGLGPGLNVIAGDNEEGKSTLLQAVRSALFDKYSSSAAQAYRPYGAGVSPTVGLVFEIEGLEYRLDKVFSRKRDGVVTLTAGDGRRWEGPQAEEFVAELLGFSYAPRGASKAEHQGLAGLLWVEQASAYQAVTPGVQARRQLHAVLSTEMSELLGGEHGEALHQRIRELHSRYFDRRNKPRGHYRVCQETQTRLAAQLERARLELQNYEHKTDQLDKRRAALRSYLDDRALEAAQAKLQAARERQTRVQALASQVEVCRQKLGLTEAEQKAAHMAWETRAKLAREQQAAQAARVQADERLAQREAEVQPAHRAVEEVQNVLASKRAERTGLEARLRDARAAEQLARLTREKAELDARLETAAAAEAALRGCQSQRDAIRVTAESLEALRRIEQDRALAEARLHSAATRLDHRLRRSASVRLAGEPLAGEGSLILSETSALEIDGIGTFTIHPGGENLDSLRAQMEDRARLLEQKLVELEAEDITAAENALGIRQLRDSEARAHQARLSGLAPHGLGELEQRQAAINGQRQALLAKLNDGTETAGDASVLERELGELADCLSGLEATLVERQRLFAERREAVVEAAAQARSTQVHVQALTLALETARQTVTDDTLAAALATAEQAVQQGKQQLTALERIVESENPATVDLDVERCERVLGQVRKDIARLENEINDLSVELNALGQRGLAEELAQIESEYQAADRELGHTESQAHAVDLLYRTLDGALRRAKEVVARPVMAKLLPYLRQLLPGAEPSINEDMELTGIQRQGTTEPFSDLSIGTREQLAVLVRLAYADLLSEQGSPVTVILDDALVNSDDERRDRMKAILYQAASRYQVLVLTCHEREYRDAGGIFIRLADCKPEGLTA